MLVENTVGAVELAPDVRVATRRRFLMCPPTWFEVTYRINPWMDPSVPVDRERAYAQWAAIRDAYLAQGHAVELLEPARDAHDMVFAANGAITSGGRALLARFAHPQRAVEVGFHRTRLRELGFDVVEPVAAGEGEGDFVHAGDRILAGTGFRTDPATHAQAAAVLGLPVHTIDLVDPRFYHLDTALAVLDHDTVAVVEPALSPRSLDLVRRLFRDVIAIDAADAAAFAGNAVSDGRHVVLPADAPGLTSALRVRGFVPVPVDVSELRKAGGGPKCVTLELRAEKQPHQKQRERSTA